MPGRFFFVWVSESDALLSVLAAVRRANDYAAWEDMVMSERNERAVHLVTQTTKFLDDLIGKVGARLGTGRLRPCLCTHSPRDRALLPLVPLRCSSPRRTPRPSRARTACRRPRPRP